MCLNYRQVSNSTVLNYFNNVVEARRNDTTLALFMRRTVLLRISYVSISVWNHILWTFIASAKTTKVSGLNVQQKWISLGISCKHLHM